MELDCLIQLIQELCPEGVEYVKLGEVCMIKRGVRVVKKELDESGEVPVFQNSLTPLGYKDVANYPAGVSYVISAGAVGEVGYSDIPFWAADDCLTITCPSEIINKYVYYFLKNNERSIKSKVRKASIPRLSRNVIDKMDFPIPPIEVQTEIVRILDQVSRVSAELNAELELRKKQYKYISQKILTFGNDVEWKKLGDVVTSLKKGTLKITDLIKDGKYKVINGGCNLYGYYDKYNNEGNVVTISSRGSAGFVSYFDEPFWAGGLCYPYRSKDENVLATKFLYYFLKYNEKKNINKLVVTGSIPALNKSTFEQLLIPIPTLKHQQEIISILDPLDRCINSVSKGIPAEIEYRIKQYKFIRDKLLTFKRK